MIVAVDDNAIADATGSPLPVPVVDVASVIERNGVPMASSQIGHPRVAGVGAVTVENIGSRSSVTRLSATSPLKLLVPRHHAQAAWVFASSYGGGLVEGDRIDMDVRIAAGATAMLGTQASTKIYSCLHGSACGQSLHACVQDDALLVLAPDPVTCFADAIYEQSQKIELTSCGSMLLIDWLTAGRVARGERWAFRRCATRTEVRIAEKLAVLDALVLDPADGPINAPHRMGRYNCLATVLLIGPRTAVLAAEVLRQIGEEPLGRCADLISCASALSTANDAVVLRVAGATTEMVAGYLRSKLAPIGEQLGDDPWGRKW